VAWDPLNQQVRRNAPPSDLVDSAENLSENVLSRLSEWFVEGLYSCLAVGIDCTV
jgi:hypothetical protein